MQLNVPAGRYIVAVSGGVDSIVLLHMLTQLPDVQLTVAHFDHGIRPDSMIDRKLVQLTARELGLPFVYHNGQLGAGASEATARAARYAFLHKVRSASGACAIITAHHQDDRLETALLNLARGTNRRGLSSLQSGDAVLRPLLHAPKQDLLAYARQHGLVWREDSTNADETYLRNYFRLRVLPRLQPQERQKLLNILDVAAEQNRQIDQQLAILLHTQPHTHVLDRRQFILLPHVVARELMAAWLRTRTGAELNRPMIERLVVAAKTGRSGSRVDINHAYWLQIGHDSLALMPRER